MSSNTRKIFMICLMAMISASTYAQGTADAPGFLEKYMLEVVLTLAAVICVIALLVLIVVLYTLKSFIKITKEQAEGVLTTAEERQATSWWSSIMQGLTAAVPVSREDEVMTDHEYDGIRELDNKLPPWWTALFYVTIIFAVGYLLHYHVLNTGPTQDEEYSIQMAEAKIQVEAYEASLALNIDETNVVMVTEESALAAGAEIFLSKCAACHANDGGGGVGPNLTDAYWKHGGSIQDLFKTVKYGVPQKGMISWKSQLTPEQMQQVSSYILTLQGTTPAAPKDPEGDLYESKTIEPISMLN